MAAERASSMCAFYERTEAHHLAVSLLFVSLSQSIYLSPLLLSPTDMMEFPLSTFGGEKKECGA